MLHTHHPSTTRYHQVKTTFTILFAEAGNKQDSQWESSSPGKNNEIQIDFWEFME